MRGIVLAKLLVVSAWWITARADAQHLPVQWRVEDGGNGHWYQVHDTRLSQGQAATAAESVGGHLVTVTSAAEHQLVLGLALPRDNNFSGVWSAGMWTKWDCDADHCYFSRWSTGEAMVFGAWGPEQPNLEIHSGGFVLRRTPAQLWYIQPSDEQLHWIVEWSRDCNNDGIIDYGQILNGQLPDANGDGVPDFCEDLPCPADIDGDGIVNGPDLAFVLSLWGTDGEPYGADINDDGSVDAMDLAYVLSDWGPCGN